MPNDGNFADVILLYCRM